jgi:hypothetical protein
MKQTWCSQLKPSDNKLIHKVVEPQDLNPEFEQKAWQT